MTMLQMWMLAGMLAMAGVGCLVWYLLPVQPDLADVMTRLGPAGARTRTHVAAPDGASVDLPGRVGRWVHGRLPHRIRSATPTRDLALLAKPVHVYYGEKVLYVAGVLVAVSLLGAVWSMMLPIPLYIPAIVTVIGAALAWFIPNLNVREAAGKARKEFSRALAAYVDLVALERKAGGAATRQAMESAAQLGDSWPFRRMAEELGRSRFAGVPPADALHELAAELGLPDLDDLADVMRLSGAEGVQVYDTLRARSSAMRQAMLTEDLAHAHTVGERMGIPTTLMAMSLAMILIAPLMLRLFTG